MLTAVINASSSGNNTIVAAVTGKRIRVLGYSLSFSGTVNAQFQDSGSNNLSGITYGVEGAQPFLPIGPNLMGSQLWWFQTTAQGQSLILNLSAAVTVGGILIYELTP